jgi:hypothetical protein
MMHSNGSGRVAVILVFLIVSLLATGGQAAAYEVGQRWVYEHQGPRFGSTEPNAIDGQRTLLVIGGPQQGHLYWVLQERYSEDEAVVSRLHVSEEQGLIGFDIENDKGEVATMTYDTPMAYPVPKLEVGQEKTIENVLRMDAHELALPVRIVMRRLADETITTPAGQFADCPHYQTTTHTTINVKVAKVPVSEQRDRWYHASVNGSVKEVYRKDPVKFLAWSQEGYTATSVLAAFDTQEIEPVAPVEVNDPPVAAPETSVSPTLPPATPAEEFPLWMPAAIAAIFAAAVVILLKRPRAK